MCQPYIERNLKDIAMSNIVIELTREDFFTLNGNKSFVSCFSETARNAIYDHITETQWNNKDINWEVEWSDVFMGTSELSDIELIEDNMNDFKANTGTMLDIAGSIDTIPYELLENKDKENVANITILENITPELLNNQQFTKQASEYLSECVETDYKRIDGGWLVFNDPNAG